MALSVVQKIVKRCPADLLIGTEALCFLALFRVALALVPVRTIIRAVTRGRIIDTTAPQVPVNLLSPGLQRAQRVRWAVEVVARNSPVAFVCFPQALAGYVMLRLRKIPATIFYGVARSPEGKLIAHTWLAFGDRTILGGEGADGFSPIERWS